MVKFLCFMFVVVSTFAWSVSLDITPHLNPICKKELSAEKITYVVAQKLLVDQNLHLVGTGARMMNEIEMLGMSFNYFNKVDISVARKLLVKAVQQYLKDINGSAEIHKYLKNYPFTANNIEIRIWICQPDGSLITDNKLNCFSALNGKLYYNFDDAKASSNSMPYPSSSIRLLHEETFDEALKILNESEQKTQMLESAK